MIKTGESVLIECDGRRIPGKVILASSNGVSLMLGFDALLDGHLGTMPVMADGSGVFHSIVTGIEVKLTVQRKTND